MVPFIISWKLGSFVVAREMGIPAIVGVSNATKVIKNNDIVMNYPETLKDDIAYDMSKIINILPEKYRTIIILHYYDDMKIKEISNVLKISESAVKKRLERARNLIKEIIERNYKNDWQRVIWIKERLTWV